MAKATNPEANMGWSASTVHRGIRRLTASGHFVRSVALLVGGTALGQAALVLASPVLTRLYSPREFGVLAVFTAVVAMLAGVTALRYELAVPLPEDDDSAASLLALCLLVTFGTSLLTGVVVWASGGQIAEWTNTPKLRPYLWLLPVTLFGAGLYLSFAAWGVRKGAFRQIARARASQGIVPAVLQVALGFAHVGAPGLLFGAAAGQIVGSEALAARAWRESRETFRRVTLQHLWRVASRYRKFPLLGAPGVLLSSFGLALPTLALATLYGPQIVGWYVLAQRIAARPLELIGSSVAQVYLSRAARIVPTRPQELPGMAVRVLGGMALVTVPYLAVLLVVARWLFPLVFGSAWEESGLYVQLLTIMLVVQVIVSPIGDTLDVLQRQDLYLLREVVRVLLLAGAIGVAAALSLGPALAILLLSIAGALTYLAFLGIAFYAIRARLRTAEASHAA